MDKKSNIVLYGICFLAAFISELYCILSKEWFSIVGIGVVVTITWYLFFDSIRTEWKRTLNNTMDVMEKKYQKELNLWDEKFTELTNIQKATYASLKKSTILMNEHFDMLDKKVESSEDNHIKLMQRILDLQVKALEGQKKALNIEVNYNKENTKQLIDVIREEMKGLSFHKQIDMETNEIGDLEENNTEETFLINEDEDNQDIPSQEIVPLYEDPYKELSTDEIAKLFSSYGT